MNNSFQNFLLKKLTVNDPSINIILNVEKLYNEKIRLKQLYLQKKINDLKKIRKNNFKTKQQKYGFYGPLMNNNLNNNIDTLKTELKSFSLFENHGLTLEEEKRYYIIRAIKKHYNLLQQLLDFNNSITTEKKIEEIKKFEKRINNKLNIKLPSKEERLILNSNLNQPNILANKKEKFAYYKRMFLDKLRNRKFPYFLDLKRGHLKYDIKRYTIFDLFPISQNKNIINRDLITNINPLSINNENIFYKFGIDKIVFDIKQIENDNINYTEFINSLLYWTKEIFLPIKLNLNSSMENDLYLAYNDIVLFYIQFFLLYIKNEIHNKKTSNENYEPGAWGAPFRIGNKVYKHEEIRYKNSRRMLYPHYNYQISVYFIGYIIQKYCHDIFKNYIPNVHKITFNLNKNRFETEMNVVKKNNLNNKNYKSCNLEKFFRKPCIYKREDFLDLFVEILKRIAIMLYDMQNKIGFVHRDFHPGNIIIIYNYEDNSINENNYPKNKNIYFEIKFIDLLFSSFLIKDDSNKLLLFKYSNWQIYRHPEMINPLISDFWKSYDLLFFIMRLLLFTFLIRNNKYIKNINNIFLNQNYDKIRRFIINKFKFKEDCLEKYMEKFPEALNKNIYNLFRDKELFTEIFMKLDTNLNYFKPFELLQSFD